MRWLSNRHKDDLEGDWWIIGKIIGRPQATEKHTIEQLEAMGYVGVYALERGD